MDASRPAKLTVNRQPKRPDMARVRLLPRMSEILAKEPYRSLTLSQYVSIILLIEFKKRAHVPHSEGDYGSDVHSDGEEVGNQTITPDTWRFDPLSSYENHEHSPRPLESTPKADRHRVHSESDEEVDENFDNSRGSIISVSAVESIVNAAKTSGELDALFEKCSLTLRAAQLGDIHEIKTKLRDIKDGIVMALKELGEVSSWCGKSSSLPLIRSIFYAICSLIRLRNLHCPRTRRSRWHLGESRRKNYAILVVTRASAARLQTLKNG